MISITFTSERSLFSLNRELSKVQSLIFGWLLPAAWRDLPPLPPPPSSELRLDMLLPLPRLPPNIWPKVGSNLFKGMIENILVTCMSCLWSMLLSRLCSSLSPRLLKSRLPGRPPIMPPPPPAAPPPDRELPGGGGLFRKSFTFLQ